MNNKFFEINGSGAFQLWIIVRYWKDNTSIDPELVSFRTIDDAVEKDKLLPRSLTRIDMTCQT